MTVKNVVIVILGNREFQILHDLGEVVCIQRTLHPPVVQQGLSQNFLYFSY
jgi:hypothetical protein